LIADYAVEQLSLMAENGGFEPPIELSPYNGLANRRLQPLGQLSVCVAVSICLSAMPGCGNYSLRLGEEDKVLQDDAVNLALSKAKATADPLRG
jgi:hypothetical protein